MKYVLVTVLDQTIGFLASQEDYEWSTVHSEALLFDTREEVEAIVPKYMAEVMANWPKDYPQNEQTIERATPFVEEVSDVAEFKARPDTW